ncbi:MAG: response regulator [Crinalium sp.]
MLNILLIEDNYDDAEQTRLQLIKSGEPFNIDHVVSFGAAIDALESGGKTRYNMILLDLGLPDLKGQDMLNQALNTLKRYEIPVTVLTGLQDLTLMKSVKKSGVEFLYKDEVLLNNSGLLSALYSVLATNPHPNLSRGDQGSHLETRLAVLETNFANLKRDIEELKVEKLSARIAVIEENIHEFKFSLKTINETASQANAATNSRVDQLDKNRKEFALEKYKAQIQIVLLVAGGFVAAFLPKIIAFIQLWIDKIF